MIKIIQRRKIWFTLSSLLFVASIVALLNWGVKLGIDFTGGTLLEFSFKDKTLNSQEIKDSLKDLNLGDISVQFSGEKNVLVRFKDVDEDTHQKILQAVDNKVGEKNDPASAPFGETPALNSDVPENQIDVNSQEGVKVNEKINPALVETNPVAVPGGNVSVTTDDGSATISAEGNGDVKVEPVSVASGALKNVEEKRFDSIGPAIGSELKTNAIWAIAIALVAMVVYIGWAFRKVSYPVSSFKYGIVATLALFHDVTITLGIFSALGHFYNVEVGLPFVAAILAVLGYSVNDTIVVFDRTRENLLRSGMSDFEEIVNKSVNETMTRSINTTYTTLLVLFCVYLFGGESIRYFIVALFVGIFFGTYSSIFIASPLLVTWHNWDLKKR
ncbi:MAG: protein translocase subunit SecF [Candidatus Paceibacterota bacterium]|jgi:preprotein translocase subunit SecF